jgi:hypothetical protein
LTNESSQVIIHLIISESALIEKSNLTGYDREETLGERFLIESYVKCPHELPGRYVDLPGIARYSKGQ